MHVGERGFHRAEIIVIGRGLFVENRVVFFVGQFGVKPVHEIDGDEDESILGHGRQPGEGQVVFEIAGMMCGIDVDGEAVVGITGISRRDKNVVVELEFSQRVHLEAHVDGMAVG